MISWAWACCRDDQEVFLSSTMAYDVEEVRMTYFNFLQMGRARESSSIEVVLSNTISTDMCLGVKDSWYQCPC